MNAQFQKGEIKWFTNLYEKQKDNIPGFACISHALSFTTDRQITRDFYPSTWHGHGCSTAPQPSNVPTASCRDKTGSEPSLFIIIPSSSGTLEKAWCVES